MNASASHRWLLAWVIFALCGCDGHWEEVEKTTGYKGKARVDPFLAAQRMLTELGHKVRSVKILGKLPASGSVVILSAEGELPAGRAKQLLRWSFNGGHLIYLLDGTRAYNDFDAEFGSFISGMMLEEENDPVLEMLGVGVQRRVKSDDMLPGFTNDKKERSKNTDGEDNEKGAWLESIQDVSWNGANYNLSLGGRQILILKRKLRKGEFSAGLKNESLALHLNHGRGAVTLLTHARPFRNHWIGERDHAGWLSALVGGGGKDVLFVAATEGSFFDLLWQYGWIALVTLTLCLVFWLWRQMPRFGPIAEVEIDTTRHFASHIGALGEFFWRMRRSTLLVDAARDAVWERVSERHRPLADGTRQMGGPLAEEISRRTGLSVSRICAAFTVKPPDSAHNFVSLMRDLQAMRAALSPSVTSLSHESDPTRS